MKKNIKILLAALAEDLVSLKIPGTATAKVITRLLVPDWLKARHYLFWDDMSVVLGFYHHDIPRLLAFVHDGTKFLLPQIMEVDNRNNALLAKNISFKATTSHFRIDNEIRGLSNRSFILYRRFLRLRFRKYFNGQLLRLSDVQCKRVGLELSVQPVFYEDYCRTNLILDAKQGGINRSIRETVQASHQLEALSDSRFANPIGINFLLFTSDGRAILPKRSQRVIIRAGQLSPSFSGVVDYTDAAAKKMKGSILFREGFEEINLLEPHIVEDSVRFLGITRELVRGGKPEIFFSARTLLTLENLRTMRGGAPDKFESTYSRSWVFWDFGSSALTDTVSENDLYGLRRSFDELLKQHGDKMSVPLLTNVVLWLRQRLGHDFSG